MNTLTCLIVDDEELARRLVRSYCDRLPFLHVVGEASNPVAAMSLLAEHAVDLLFLDIQMPEMRGTDFLRITPKRPAVILTTAYSEFALEGYELDVVDYLLKPFSFDRFVQAVNKVARTAAPPNLVPAAAPDKTKPTYQIVKADYKTYRIPHSEILYIESMREYVVYHRPEGKTMALGSLKKLEAELPENFMRVHKSYIVAQDRISHLDGNTVWVGDKQIPVGGSYRGRVQELFKE